MLRKPTPTQSRAVLSTHNWNCVLFFNFPPKYGAKALEADLKDWLRKESDLWCGDEDDDDDGTENRASYFMLGTPGDFIQGPAFYVLLAGVTTDVEDSVRDWNEAQEGTCHSVHFSRFGEKAGWRRDGLLQFLGGLFFINYLASYHVELQHRLPDGKVKAK
jgi:hypothetical protein